MTCGSAPTVDCIKSSARRLVKSRSASTERKKPAVLKRHMWVAHPSPKNGVRLDLSALNIVCGCDQRWVPELSSNKRHDQKAAYIYHLSSLFLIILKFFFNCRLQYLLTLFLDLFPFVFCIVSRISSQSLTLYLILSCSIFNSISLFRIQLNLLAFSFH